MFEVESKIIRDRKTKAEMDLIAIPQLMTTSQNTWIKERKYGSRMVVDSRLMNEQSKVKKKRRKNQLGAVWYMGAIIRTICKKNKCHGLFFFL